MNAIAGHLLGDILLQNRWLARVKRNTWWGLAIHCAIVTVAIEVMTGFQWSVLQYVLVAVTHYAIDGFGLGKEWWPRLLDQGDPDSTEPAPTWLRLMDDQALHIVALALIGGFAR